jgi:hypothetical protein
MTLREPHEDARLTGAQVAMIRELLIACSHLLGLAERHGGPYLNELMLATEARSPDRLRYEVNLAIDHLDFAPAVRRGAW